MRRRIISEPLDEGSPGYASESHHHVLKKLTVKLSFLILNYLLKVVGLYTS